MRAENILRLFSKLGNQNYRTNQDEIDSIFASDFVMIANAKHVCDYAELYEHFVHISDQIGHTTVEIHEIVVTENKEIVRYDLISGARIANTLTRWPKRKDSTVIGFAVSRSKIQIRSGTIATVLPFSFARNVSF